MGHMDTAEFMAGRKMDALYALLRAAGIGAEWKAPIAGLTMLTKTNQDLFMLRQACHEWLP